MSDDTHPDGLDASAAPSDEISLVVGAVILDGDRAFVQRRSLEQPLFPGCWDIAGGHVEDGETVVDALRREIREETGWELRRVLRKVTEMCWEAGGRRRLELDYMVEVDGDLGHPQLDPYEHVEWRWITANDLPTLLEHRDPADKAVHDIVELAFHV